MAGLCACLRALCGNKSVPVVHNASQENAAPGENVSQPLSGRVSNEKPVSKNLGSHEVFRYSNRSHGSEEKKRAYQKRPSENSVIDEVSQLAIRNSLSPHVKGESFLDQDFSSPRSFSREFPEMSCDTDDPVSITRLIEEALSKQP